MQNLNVFMDLCMHDGSTSADYRWRPAMTVGQPATTERITKGRTVVGGSKAARNRFDLNPSNDFHRRTVVALKQFTGNQ